MKSFKPIVLLLLIFNILSIQCHEISESEIQKKMDEINRRIAIEELQKEKEMIRRKQEKIKYCKEYNFIYENRYFELLYARFVSAIVYPSVFGGVFYLFFWTKWSYPLGEPGPDYLGAVLLIFYCIFSLILSFIILHKVGVDDSIVKFVFNWENCK